MPFLDGFRLSSVLLSASLLSAQWLHYPTPWIPRTPDGKPEPLSTVPRTQDGNRTCRESGRHNGKFFQDPVRVGLNSHAAMAKALYEERKGNLQKAIHPTLPWARVTDFDTMHARRISRSWSHASSTSHIISTADPFGWPPLPSHQPSYQVTPRQVGGRHAVVEPTS